VAALLGVSDDTVRRWVEGGRLTDHRERGRHLVDGAEVAALARELAKDPARAADGRRASARNRLTGIVTDVLRDKVMAQVEIQAGPFRIVSLMTREAADELGLQPGVLAVASIKSTNVVVERLA
jgi:molybdopterin-binding protein